MLSSLRNLLKNQTDAWLVLIVSFSVLFSLAFEVMLFFPMDQSPDIQDYLKMAGGDWEQSPVRMYRVLVPILAGMVHFCFGWMFEFIHPDSFNGNFSLCFSFLLVNTWLMSIASVFIFKLCKGFGLNLWQASCSLIPFLSCRWTLEISGLPLVDSLYFLCLVLMLYAYFNKNQSLMLASIFIGPWAKEAYVFFVPLILYMNRDHLVKCVSCLIGSGILVFGFRLFWDSYLQNNFLDSFMHDADSFSTIGYSINKIVSLHGIYDVFSVTGFWILIPSYVWIINNFNSSRKFNEKNIVFAIFILAVFIQILLSGDIGRMLYLVMPIFCYWIAVCFNSLFDLLLQRKNEGL